MEHRAAAPRLGAVFVLVLVILGAACRPAPRHQATGRRTLLGSVGGTRAGQPTAGDDADETVALDAGTVEDDPGELDVELPEGRVTAYRVAVARRGAHDLTWIGRTVGAPAPDVLVSAVNGAVAVHVQRASGAVVAHSTGRGGGVRSRIPDDDITPENEPVLSLTAPDALAASAADTAIVAAAAADAVTTVDVMVVFNTAMATRYGAAAMPAVVQNAIDRANKAYADSQTNVQLRLVHVEQVPDREIAATLFSNVANLVRSQRVAQLRDQYGADLVQAWGTYPSVCGQGYQPLPGQFRASYGFSVINAVNSGCANGVGPAHEIGHNLGAGHDRQTDRAQGRAGDAYGLVDEPHDFMTVMAYQRRTCPGGSCTQSWLFSNPSVTFRGFPVGRAGSEDNARNIRANAATVAQFRAPRV
jgi:hypothetical protein